MARRVEQTMSYVDGILPESQREAYEKAPRRAAPLPPSSSRNGLLDVEEKSRWPWALRG